MEVLEDINIKYPEGTENLSKYGKAFIDFLIDKKLNGITNIGEIIQVCEKIEKDHKGRKRESGGNYVDHLYEVTRNYIELHGEKISQKRIIACLLHDNIEDIKGETYKSLKEQYGPEIAFVVHVLSIKKDKKGNATESKEKYLSRFISLESIKIFIKEEGKLLGIPVQDYKKKKGDIQRKKGDFTLSKNKIRTLAHEIAAIKLSDRINNLSTEEVFGTTKANKKITQTEKYLLPLARDLGNPVFLGRLQNEIVKLHRRITRKKAENALKREKDNPIES